MLINRDTLRIITLGSDQLSKCLTSDFFDKDHLEPKDVYEIPAYYLSMMLKSELQVKTEENQENHEV